MTIAEDRAHVDAKLQAVREMIADLSTTYVREGSPLADSLAQAQTALASAQDRAKERYAIRLRTGRRISVWSGTPPVGGVVGTHERKADGTVAKPVSSKRGAP